LGRPRGFGDNLRLFWLLLPWLAIVACSKPQGQALTVITAPPNAELDSLHYAATVSRSHVRLVFPPLHQDTFEWWSPAQRQQLTTYSWTVLVRGAADTLYSVGYWLPTVGIEVYARWYAESRPVPTGTQHGRLAELLAAGMQDVRQIQDHIAVPVPDMRVQVRAEGTRVTVERRPHLHPRQQ
jgi:hypothetical protein